MRCHAQALRFLVCLVEQSSLEDEKLKGSAMKTRCLAFGCHLLPVRSRGNLLSKTALMARCLRLVLSAFACLLIASGQSSNAAVIFDNFDAGGGFHPQNNLGAADIQLEDFFTNAIRAAAQFTVSGGDFKLTSITLPIS